MRKRLFDDYDDFEEVGGEQIGTACGRGQYVCNPIGFGKDISPPFRLPLKFVYDATGEYVCARLYTSVNGTIYELKPINKKALRHFEGNLYGILGDKHYEHD